MSSTTFATGTVIPSVWLNDVNNLVYNGVIIAAGLAVPILTATTKVVTPVLTNGGTLEIQTTTLTPVDIQINSVPRWRFNTDTSFSLNPFGDATQNIGSPTTRLASVFSTVVDSGTTSSLLFNTNNGISEVEIVHSPSAVNRIQLTGAATAFPPTLSVAGTDTDIGLLIKTKGVGQVLVNNAGGSTQFAVGNVPSSSRFPIATAAVSPNQAAINSNNGTGIAIEGTSTTTNAPSGAYGEYIESNIVSGSSISLTTATTANITSISLTAGDWDISGAICFTFGTTTSYTNLTGGSSTTTITLGAQVDRFDFETAAVVPTAGSDMTWVIPTTRLSINTTTTVFLTVQGTFTVSTLKAYGKIRARRMR